jgi:hypothetical protein
VAVLTGVNNDINVLLSPALTEKLNSFYSNPCKKRDSNCYADAIEDVENSDDPLIKEYRAYVQNITFISDQSKDKYSDLIEDTGKTFQKRGVILAAAALSETLGEASVALSFLYAAAVGFATKLVVQTAYAINVVPINIPTISAPKKNGGDGDGDGNNDGCPKDAPTGKDAPLCDDCDGKDTTCTKV